MPERKNTGLAVPHAKRLNARFIELSEAIAARPAVKGDRALWQYDYTALPGGPAGAEREAWNHGCGSNDVALVALRGALTNGNLELWTYSSAGETKVDRHELKELTFRTFKSGTYQPDNRRLDTAGLADTPLWVKDADWLRYMLDLWAIRYGLDWANPAPPADTPQLPPEGQFVTLSHALTWVAFGVSMSNAPLHSVLSLERYGEHNSCDALKGALARLTDLGGRGRIEMRGKYRSRRDDDEKALLTETIEPIKLGDYGLFSYPDNELRHGSGVLLWHSDGAFLDEFQRGGRKDSHLSVTVNRAALLREFPPRDLAISERELFRCAESFTRDDQATIAPWWSVNQALAWIASRILSYVEHVGEMETELYQRHPQLMTHATVEHDMERCDEAIAFFDSRHASWPRGKVLGHAGRSLLAEIQSGAVEPSTSEDGRGRPMTWHEFAGLGKNETGADWLDLSPQPLFSSEELMRVFPMGEVGSADAATVTSTTGAEKECREWLASQFAADADKQRRKAEFQRGALAKFSGRLSVRGFIRAWDAVAPAAGRSKPGPKS